MVDKSVINLLEERSVQQDVLALKRRSGDRVLGDLVKDRRCVSPNEPFQAIVAKYLETPGLMPVVEEGVLKGVIRQHQMMQAFTSHVSGVDVSVKKLIEQANVVLPPSRRVHSLSHYFKDQHVQLGSDPVIVAESDGKYVGVVDAGCLLEAVSSLAQAQARYTNPLTGLPSRVVVDEKVSQLTKENVLFVVAHVSINDLHAYNESYGYSKGDEVIRQVASVLDSICEIDSDCLAHLHGGRFTLVFQSADWFERCETVINTIDEIASQYYSKKDQWEGGVTTVNRLGDRHFSPFFSLSIGAVPVYPGKFDSCHEIFSAASEVEQRASQTAGGAIYVDQRNYRSDMGELTVRLS